LPWEREAVQTAGISYIWIPSNAARVESRTIHAVLDAVRTAQRPIFIHCKAGRDRTGLQVAVYRMTEMGDSRDAALKDLYDCGYNWFMFSGIQQYLRSFSLSDYRPQLAGAQVRGGI